MRLEGSAFGKGNAKRLRHQMTPPEIALWLALRRNEAGLRFRRQHGAADYVLDFYCTPARLVIEVDGEAHERGDRPTRDASRDAWLAAHGLRVIRYAATDVLTNLEGVVRQIIAIAVDRRDRIESGRLLPLRRRWRHLPLAGEDKGRSSRTKPPFPPVLQPPPHASCPCDTRP